MTEAETLELIAIYAANAMNAFAIFSSFTFAYLATAYFVGAALSSFQVFSISGLYVASSLAMGTSCVISTQAWGALIDSRDTLLTALILYTGGYWDVFVAILLSTVIVISLYFMYNVRRTAAERDENLSEK